MRTIRYTVPAALAAALLASLAACGSSPGTSGPTAPVRPSSSSPAPSLTALRSWWASVQGGVTRLADDLSTGDSSAAALAADRRDIAALQADPGFPSGNPAAASAWTTALADYASAVAALQQGESGTAGTLFDQGTAALDTVLASITSASN
jgi:hypothetical protein